MSILRLGLLLLSAVACLPAEDPLRFGQPACSGPVLDKKYFIICYDQERRVPRWVGYALTREDVSHAALTRASSGLSFRADTALPRGERAENSDYRNSLYDKGHMAPAADFTRSREAMKATFVLSNAVPQRHGVNAGLWRELELAARALPETQGTTWIFSGPVFIGGKPLKTIGAHQVAVPTHTFKVILCERSDGTRQVFAYVLPNLDQVGSDIVRFAYSVNYVERLTSLDFFDKLPDEEERKLERTVAGKMPGR